ncbi:MAG: hypothetical protein HYY06_17475 [Deltaproteobacteria bacterium]|nr:hypothetical protein [Deltaproteobacteria bacterium]
MKASLISLLLLGGCGGGQAAGPSPRAETGPSEAVCRLGSDPAAHVGLLQPRASAAATVEPGTSPLGLDVSGDGQPEMIFLARTASDRWLAVVGCQDFAVMLLGAFKMPGLAGTVRIEPFAATRAPAHEIKAVLEVAEASSSQEFWAFFGFDGADLAQVFGWFVSHVPPQGDASRAAVTFRDENGDALNEIFVAEETLDGDGARARLANAAAPLPRITATRMMTFRYDSTRRMFSPAAP